MSQVHSPARRALSAIAALLIALLLIPAVAPAKNVQHSDRGRGKVVNVMTRNVYLGANLLPAIAAPDLNTFVEANGQILREVTANDFPTRARGLAAEIRSQRPDLVGLQEVALWRTGPPTLEPVLTDDPTATTVRYDYLQLLLNELNKGSNGKGKGKAKGAAHYRVLVSEDEFDFEAPANENGVAGDGPNPAIPNAEINGRLTMRDVILVRRGAGISVKSASGGHFGHLFVAKVSGVPVPITRGWTAADVKVRGSHLFRFVNTHLEAYDDATRTAQAEELVAPGGPATSKRPVVLVGDLNSDDDTVPVSSQGAYNALIAAGMAERSTNDPLSCCLNSSLLAVGAGGSVTDFDHQVDHIMTSAPAQVTLLRSTVTGLQPVNGFWDSDHAGVFSALRFSR